MRAAVLEAVGETSGEGLIGVEAVAELGACGSVAGGIVEAELRGQHREAVGQTEGLQGAGDEGLVELLAAPVGDPVFFAEEAQRVLCGAAAKPAAASLQKIKQADETLQARRARLHR